MGCKLYLECASGIAGDMAVASMLDLGVPEDGLFRTLGELMLEGYEAHSEIYMNESIRTRRFSVALEDLSHPDLPGEINYDKSDDTESNSLTGSCHSHEHGQPHSHEHGHTHTHGISGEHIHEHSHSDHHDHEGHVHFHRNLKDISEILDRLSDERVRTLADRIFRIVAEAEASVHGMPLEEVHFHEVGAVDSIVDIVSAAYCFTALDVEEVLLGTIREGYGTIHCAHGDLPVPVPAVTKIAEKYRLPLTFTDIEGELVTPTGAAIAAVLWKGNGLPGHFSIRKTGVASGHRKYRSVSMLRAMIVETAADSGEIVRLETNIDDSTGEALGFVMEELMREGAKDVYYTPIYMKKNRPAYMLTVLCDGESVKRMEQIIFTHTTTIGIRRCAVERDCLERELRTVQIPCGEAAVKICTFEGKRYIYPEYESVKKICQETGLPFQEVCAAITSAVQ